MSIDSAIYTRLSGFAGLSALVGTRIYPPPLPQITTYPAVSYLQISAVRDYVMGNQSGLVHARFEINSWATTTITARSVAEQVRLALSNYHGTSDSVVINWTEMVSPETVFYEDETKLHGISQDYIVTYSETTP